MTIPQPTLDEDDDPVKKYLDERASQPEVTRRDAERVLVALRKYIHQEYGRGATLDEVTSNVIVNFGKQMLTDGITSRGGMAKNTAEAYMYRLKDFYSWGSEYGYPNPVEEALNRLNWDTGGEPGKIPEIPPSAWSELLKRTKNLQIQAIVMTYLKTGARLGDMVNFDISDVNIDHSGFKNQYDHIDFYKHSPDDVQLWPDTLYFRNDVTMGDTVENEKRKSGTKRETATHFPIDRELKVALLRWLKVRPKTPDNPNNPLFLKKRSPVAGRIEAGGVYYLLNEYFDRRGFDWEFQSHDFRRYWNTYLRAETGWGANLPDPILRYLRGDSMTDDMLDLYTQSWSRKVREPYENQIYSLL